MDSFKDATRTNTGLLAAAERRALISLAERMPAWITSDHLTGLGLFSMLMVGVSYGVSRWAPLALWWVVVWLAVNWFGDSLDGTLARVRRQPRPRYGFYVDHIVDCLGVLFVCVGLAWSGYMTPSIAMALLVAYYMLSIEIYLATYCLAVFRLS